MELTYSKSIQRKKPNQNILDFVLTNYGSLEYIFEFLTDNDYDSMRDFYLSEEDKKFVTPVSNFVTAYYKNNGIIVNTKF